MEVACESRLLPFLWRRGKWILCFACCVRPKEMAVFLFLQAQTIAQDKIKNTHICNKFTKKVTKNIKIDH